MPELAARLPCPVCLGTTMEKIPVGSNRPIEVDHCRRCGGIWFEQGEVQRLRALPRRELQRHLDPRDFVLEMRCHDCHTLLDRTAEKCPGCGWSNALDCPECARPMQLETYAGLRLDICGNCKGVWFDHQELETIWEISFDRALRRRRMSRGDIVGAAEDVGGNLLFNALFFAPDLVYFGGHAIGSAVSATAQTVANLPRATGAAPEAAASAVEAVGEAAGNVFGVIVEIISGIFDGF